MQKKIGILTFHKSINYGSVLQAYALSKTLEGFDYNVEIIDYEPKRYNEIYGLYQKNNSLKHLFNNIFRRYPFRQAHKNRQEVFKNFRQNILNLSAEKYYFNSDFEALNDKYDVLIVGSDQIWNIFAPDCDDIYFLPIEHKAKKIAYAVSLNNATYTESRCDNVLKSWIMDFDALSSREESGCERLYHFLDGKRQIINALDPTLIADAALFNKIKAQCAVSKPYIFLYSISLSKQVVHAATRLSKKTGLPIYTIMTGVKSYKYLYVNSDHIHILQNHLSPEDFLGFVANAKYVVTNSFHGTAFSLIFNKEFYTICKIDSNDERIKDERIYNILAHLNLLNRIVSVNEIDKLNLDDQIDYEIVNKKKEELTALSRKFLIDAIEG